MTRNISINKLLVALIDIGLFAASFFITLYWKFGQDIPSRNMNDFLFMLPWFIIVFIFMANVYDLYSEYVKHDEKTVSLIFAILITGIINIALSFLFQQFAVPRTIFVASSLLQLALLGAWRYLVWTRALLVKEQRQALLVGTSAEIACFQDSINSNLDRGLKIVSPLMINDPQAFCEKWRAFLDSPEAANIEIIILCASISEQNRIFILDYCIVNNKALMVVPGIYDILMQKARLVSAGDMPVMQIKSLTMNHTTSSIKRASDIFLSVISGIITLPLNILIALAIKLDSPGPVLYSQERTGLNGNLFTLYKFRTMVCDAEKLTGPVLATEEDPRITRVGRILRKIRLDEIPQFWNVLKGDMSMVGPRPERPYFVNEFKADLPQFDYRHQVKGGITGLAQVEGRYSTEPTNKLSYDLMYARNASPGLDFVILLRTAKVLFLKGKAC
jgi:exopolysaccharide biosynthesis polyprenyl glycosylphosphotransferase